MEKSLIYWLLIFCWIIFSGWMGWGPSGDRRWFGFGFIGFLLFVVIGLTLYGQPIK